MTKEEKNILFHKIIDDIIYNMECIKKGVLSDIGNVIECIIGHNTCKNNKDQNIDAFQKHNFLNGFKHGYSLQDGTHG